MINLDYQSRTPIYEQIVNEIERFVVLGVLKPKEQIPSVRDLASSLGINPNTVSKAYNILEERKIIMTISTKGTFIHESISRVAEEKQKKIMDEILKNVEEYQKMGGSVKKLLEAIQKKEG